MKQWSELFKQKINNNKFLRVEKNPKNFSLDINGHGKSGNIRVITFIYPSDYGSLKNI